MSKRLDKVTEGILNAAKAHATAEEAYDIAMMREVFRLKEEGSMPATLIERVAKGVVAEKGLRSALTLAEDSFKATVKGADTLMSEMSGLQSLLRTQEEIDAASA